MSKKIIRVHTVEPVYVGPKEPDISFPPSDTLTHPERLTEWTFADDDIGGVIITHRNPRAKELVVNGKKIPTPDGQVFVTRVGAGNLRDVQYEFEPIAPAKTKGAA